MWKKYIGDPIIRMVEVCSQSMRRFVNKLLKKIKGNNSFADSGAYWESRYKSGGHSGGGSYGRLALYKADFINTFIRENAIQSALEWGCGDGHQTSLLRCDNYLGLDVSQTVISLCRKKFDNDSSKTFALAEEYKFQHRMDMAMSLDVIYHLVEDTVFSSYMHDLFKSASRYVVIYSCNFDAEPTANHVRPRKFSDFIDLHFPEWKMIYTEENPYPMSVMNDPATSWSRFFVYQRLIQDQG